MPTRFRKIRKQRGSRYHGWGQVGQHRKSGGQGGIGQAGLLKHKKSWMIKYDPEHFGKKGFTSPRQKGAGRWISISRLDELYATIRGVKSKAKVLNLTEMGYSKLLGQGVVKGSYKVIVPSCSESAKRKIEEAGGSIEAVG